MKSVCLLALFLVLVSCSCAGRQYPHQAPTMKDISVVRITAFNHDHEVEGYCTAWKLDENHMVTAGHCCEYDAPVAEEGEEEEIDPLLLILGQVKTEKRTVAYFRSEGTHAIPGELARVVQMDTNHDSCVLKGKMRGASIPLAANDPPLGERVYTAGFPRGVYLISEGLWSGRSEEYSVASLSVWGGASGSPILNHEGKAVGILVAYYRPFDNLSLITPLEWLRAIAISARKPLQ